MTLVACIGGGQLGRMLGLAGLPLGLRFRFLDPSPDAPAADVGELVVGEFDDPAALARLAAGADVVTYEFENVSVDGRSRRSTPLPPSRALELGQDRLVEKQLFRAARDPDGPVRLARRDGAAGARQVATARLRRQGPAAGRAAEELGEHELAEEIVAFDRELSIIGVRGRDGETRFWPLAENVHRDGILRVSRAPAVAAPQAEAEELAGGCSTSSATSACSRSSCSRSEGRLLANEFAPRVHNTGHWTIEGAVTSQFENHLRAILGLPLGVDRCDRVVGDGQPDRRRPARRGAAPRSPARTSTSTARSRAAGASSGTSRSSMRGGNRCRGDRAGRAAADG